MSIFERHFAREECSDVADLRAKLDHFYATTRDYSAFQETTHKPEFWEPIRCVIEERVRTSGQCTVLEFGAGRTGFADYLGPLRDRVRFTVQDVTDTNREYLEQAADDVLVGPLHALDGRYDVIFSTFVWEHITDPRRTLRLLIAMLNGGGQLFIACPCYDFPFYLSPSSRHYSKLKRFLLGVWLWRRRIRHRRRAQADFLIHLDPAVIHTTWFRDADAIHWVSRDDLRSELEPEWKMQALEIGHRGLRRWFWVKFLLLFVQIQRANDAPFPDASTAKRTPRQT